MASSRPRGPPPSDTSGHPLTLTHSGVDRRRVTVDFFILKQEYRAWCKLAHLDCTTIHPGDINLMPKTFSKTNFNNIGANLIITCKEIFIKLYRSVIPTPALPFQ